MDTSKTVDVVMCTYNGERYLREQLDSIIGQTYPIHRLIVQDDRSTDGTVAIVREYAARYPFISLYVNGRNLGYNLNFKSAVMRATADFVAISDQDDVWFADKIARQVEAIGGHNICFSAHVRGSRLEGARRVEPQHSLKALLFHGLRATPCCCAATMCSARGRGSTASSTTGALRSTLISIAIRP